LRSEHLVAVEIMFPFGSLSSILNLKMFEWNTIWDEYILKVLKTTLGILDEFYWNTSDCVIARRENRAYHSVDLLKKLDQPVKNLINYDSTEITASFSKSPDVLSKVKWNPVDFKWRQNEGKKKTFSLS